MLVGFSVNGILIIRQVISEFLRLQCALCVKWCHFEWPWVTHNLDLKVNDVFTVFSTSNNWKMVKIELWSYLQWQVDTIYRPAPFAVTVNGYAQRGLCRSAVSVCPSVCLSVTFVYYIEMSKLYCQTFSPSCRSHFRTKRHGNIRIGTPTIGGRMQIWH